MLGLGSPMLHLGPHGDAYGERLSRLQIRWVCRSKAAATSAAENHVGLPLDSEWIRLMHSITRAG